MADGEKWKERRDQIARYRVMEQEATDPLAAGLLRDIVSELEAEMDSQLMAASDLALEPGMIEFHERTVSCLVRNLSASGASLDAISPRENSGALHVGAPIGRGVPSLLPHMAEEDGDRCELPAE